MMYNSLCVGAELRESRFNHLINGSTNVLFYNTVIIVHYVFRTKREVEEASDDVSEGPTSIGSGPFSFYGHCFSSNFRPNYLYESKGTWQYKFGGVKSYYKGKDLTSG